MIDRRTVTVGREDLLKSYDPERVFGYCAACKNHGRLWTCPPHDRDPLKILGTFDAVVLYRWIVPFDRDDKLELFDRSRKKMAASMLVETGEGEMVLIAGECFACDRCTRIEGRPCAKPLEKRYSLESLGFDVQAVLARHFGEALLFPDDPDFPGYTLVGARILRDPSAERPE